MTTQEIATRVAELCKKGEFETAQKEMYAQDVTSIEPEGTPEFEKEVKGIDKIFEKGNKFMSMVEAVHSVDTSTPIVAGNSFAFVLTMDITMKGRDRMKMQELCVYTTKDGKVISEQFYM
ncbi:SnoaL-like domain-containing protein [Chitinophaga ginsengisoli]|uniref:SnoaL-like domain-containing protein n=1 Tax=Chitinophaga ginsengisoli TaxID=363837 RepID=A0A2P8GQ55_9BACT|nr:SnoaL-like domain-containing protein [Chitinophaga ginsengisoli]PSL36084.1 hypothetical protein CLV42_101852 [Chitinophaga ginsengisoli]